MVCTGRPFGASSDRTHRRARGPTRGVSARPNSSCSLADARRCRRPRRPAPSAGRSAGPGASARGGRARGPSRTARARRDRCRRATRRRPPPAGRAPADRRRGRRSGRGGASRRCASSGSARQPRLGQRLGRGRRARAPARARASTSRSNALAPPGADPAGARDRRRAPRRWRSARSTPARRGWRRGPARSDRPARVGAWTSSATRNSPSRTPLSRPRTAPVPGRQHQRRALRLAAPGQAIGVAGEQRPPQVRLGEAAPRGAAAGAAPTPVLDLARHLVHVRRQRRPRVERAEQVARRRLAAGRRELALREDRAGPRRVAGAARLDQDAGQPRRQRQRLHPPAERRERAAVEGAEPLQQPARAAATASAGGASNHSNAVGIGAPRRQSRAAARPDRCARCRARRAAAADRGRPTAAGRGPDRGARRGRPAGRRWPAETRSVSSVSSARAAS